jgi:ATPase family associated with various cellular activities (AAA)
MPKPAKVLHHIKGLINSLSISVVSDANVDSLVQALCQNYKEYTLESVAQVREAVALALPTALEASNVTSQPNRVMSLNQMVSAQYRNITSKRHRPVEEPDIDTAAGNTQVDSSLDGNQQPPHATGNPASTEANPSQGSQGIAPGRKKVKSNRDGTSGKGASGRMVGDGNVDDDITNAILNRRQESEFLATRPSLRLADLAGIDSIISQIREMVFYPVLYPDLYGYLGVQPPTGLLLHGPSGCGKTSLAQAIAGELGLPFLKASGPELIGGTSGESEGRIRDIFQAAADKAPSILFIDAIDVIAAKKDGAQRGMDRRVVAQLSDCIDSISTLSSGVEEEEASTGAHPALSNGVAAGVSTSTGSPEANGTQETNAAAPIISNSSGFSSSSSSSNSSSTDNQSKAGLDNRKKKAFVVLLAATNK